LRKFYRNNNRLIFAILFAGIAWLLSASSLFIDTPDQKASRFNKTFLQKDSELKEQIDFFSSELSKKTIEDIFRDNQDLAQTLFPDKGISIYIFKNEELKFWSDNELPLLNFLQLSDLKFPAIKLQNGIYSLQIKQHGEFTIAGLLLIKHEYPHQNDFLVNRFQEDFFIDREVIIHLDESDYPIQNLARETVFYLHFPSADYVSEIRPYAILFFSSLALIFLLLFFQEKAKELMHKIHPLWVFVAFSGILILLRFLTIEFQFPAFLYKFEIFSPTQYATSEFFPSLGDLLLNILLLLYLIYFFYSNSFFKEEEKAGKRQYIYGFLLLSILAMLYWFLTSIMAGMVLHSNIPFNLNNFFSLNKFSLAGFFVTALILFSLYLLSDKTINILKKWKIDRKYILLLAIFPSLLFIGLTGILKDADLLMLLWPFPIIFIVWLTRIRQKKNYSFTSILIIVFVFSVFTSHLLSRYSNLREQKTRKVLIQKFARDQDPVAEFLYRQIEKDLKEDEFLSEATENYWDRSAEVEYYMRERYLSGYWNKFDFQVNICWIEDELLISDLNTSQNCVSFFDSIIDLFGTRINNTNLYFLNNTTGRISYLAKIPIRSVQQEKSWLFIELDSKFLPEGTGYPELLMDASELLYSPELHNYSFAKYKDDKLAAKAGIFPYSLNPKTFTKNFNQDIYFLEKGDFNHLIYQPDEQTVILLSQPNEKLIDSLTEFSYLFAFYSLLLLLVLFFRQISTGIFSFWHDFKIRLQVIIIGTILIAIFFFGAGTIFFIKNQFSIKNNALITEKISSVLIELEHKLSGEPSLTSEMEEYLTQYLTKFSNVFFTDINLYDLDGNLLASSRKEIFDKGLSGRKMDPIAFSAMVLDRKTELIQEENLGKLNYISAYVPFFNVQGEQLAILNLPYFAKQSELEEEISVFLVALINIYVLLFVFSVVMAIFLSNFITGPLQLIRTKLRDVKLGKSNELIEWNGRDEIGSLVNEYNRMIVELSESAERLAQSERESAWREMARQVAHEIKNPLTPMKLSVQHLERAWKDKAPDIDKKLEKFTRTLVEQIDTLSDIASEFSNFAKMPESNPENFNVVELAKNVVNLFKDTPEAEVIISSLSSPQIMVRADKNQLLRVFNNLIKNAIQSMPVDQKGRVEISIKTENNFVLIEVKDNGEGIPDDQKEKIFVPSFTTKTGGSGLGLPITKNIVNDAGGRIWFKSVQGSGTIFYVELPLVKS
jgi:two-component system, NtrC family, nitrogen regulation sensor histidine kinase NtrY